MSFRAFFLAIASIGLLVISPLMIGAKDVPKQPSSKKSGKVNKASPLPTKNKNVSKEVSKTSASKKLKTRTTSRNRQQQKISSPPKTTSVPQTMPYVQVFSDRSEVSPGLNFWVMVHFRASPHAYLSAPNQPNTVPAPEISISPESSVHRKDPLWPAPSAIKNISDDADKRFLAYDKPFSVLIPLKVPFYSKTDTLTIPVSVKYYACMKNSCEEKTYQTNLSIKCNSVESVASPHQKMVLSGLSFIPTPAEKLRDWKIQIYPSAKNQGDWFLSISPSIQRILYPRKLQVIPAIPLQSNSVMSSYEVDVVPSGSSSAKDYNYQIRIAKNAEIAPMGQFYLVSDLPWDEARKKRVLLISTTQKMFPKNISDKSTKVRQIEKSIRDFAFGSANKGYSLLKILWYAFLGGMILNLMPCVFPVLSIKVLSIISSHQSSAQQRRSKLWGFNLGVIASFLTLATIILGFQSIGKTVGWGFQLQSPGFVTFLLIFFLSITANFWGWFDVPSFSFSMGAGISSLNEFVRSFISGCIATLIATPCTGPFLGIAMGFSLSQPPLIVLLIFLSIAVGMVTPVTVLSVAPFLSIFIPKPGVWMENLRMFLSFPLLATCVWLGFVRSGLLPNSIPVLLGLGCVCWLSCFWLFGKTQKSKNPISFAIFAIFCAITGVVSVITTQKSFGPGNGDSAIITTIDSSVSASFSTVEKAGLTWVTFSKDTLAKLLDEKKNLFVMVTANWCMACKMKEASMMYEKSAIADAIREKKIVPVLADLTQDNREIQEFLTTFNRMSIPFAVIFPNGSTHEPIILPDGYSMKDLLKTFSKL